MKAIRPMKQFAMVWPMVICVVLEKRVRAFGEGISQLNQTGPIMPVTSPTWAASAAMATRPMKQFAMV